MTAVSESARPTTDPPRQPLALCVLVAVGVVVGWLAYDRWVLPRLHARLLDWSVVRERGWLVSLTFVPRGEHVLMNELVTVLPIVAAALACWAIDELELRRTATGPAYDEGPPPP